MSTDSAKVLQKLCRDNWQIGHTSVFFRACFKNRFWVGHGFSRAAMGNKNAGFSP